MSDKDRRRDKKRRREKRKRKGQKAGTGPVQLARCGGGRPYTREECLAAAAADPEGGSAFAYLADPGGVVIDGPRVVNRLDRAVEVSVTIRQIVPTNGPAKIRTLSNERIPANGFIDYGEGNATPLFVLSAFADDAEVQERLQANGEYVMADPPDSLGPWHAADGLPDIRFTAGYIHNANLNQVKIIAVCRAENEAGHARCAIFRGVVGGRFLGDVRLMASGATAVLLTTDAELAAEAAALKAAFDADVAAGRITAAEAADLMTFDDPDAERIDPETVELLAVLPRGCSRKAARAVYERAVRKA